MNIPPPIPLGPRPTFALGAPFGHVLPTAWERAVSSGAAPVVLHTLGSEKERARIGPRELRDATCASLARIGHECAWGLGGLVLEADEAAQFATAGFTWFTFDLRGRINRRAAHMSLDELDAAIVALEDTGCYPPGWHISYLDRAFGTTPPLSFTDEQLARAAVAFGEALAHAEQLQQAVRVCWAGRGELPDIEVTIAETRTPTSQLDTLFITSELRRRGIPATTFSPSLGSAWPLGAGAGLSAEEVRDSLAAHHAACALGGIAKVGIHLTAEKGDTLAGLEVSHHDETSDAWLHALRLTAGNDPAIFRAWLTGARETFAIARGDKPIRLNDDEAFALPEVPDDQLAPMFLDAAQGRQLLLASLDEVRASESGTQLAEFLRGFS